MYRDFTHIQYPLQHCKGQLLVNNHAEYSDWSTKVYIVHVTKGSQLDMIPGLRRVFTGSEHDWYLAHIGGLWTYTVLFP